ncbi:MAG: hypothetical protein K5762_00620, partial [Bacilli bacterium]|nr:hypothetical protein [Bacilli bacterium]
TRLHADLIRIYKDFIVYQSTQDAKLLDRLKADEVQSLDLTLDEARRNIDYLLTAKREYRNTDDVFSHFELTLLSLMSELIVAAPMVPQAPVAKEVKPKANTIVSVATEVKSEKQEKGIDIEVKKEDTGSDRITCTQDDILNLMLQADKQARINVSAKWNTLEQFFFDQNKAFQAKAMSTSKVRLVAKNILLITNPFAAEIDKINTKATQPILRAICKELFQEEYYVLPVTEDEYKGAIQKYKMGERPAISKPNIDFGDTPDLNASTDFLNDLLG